MVNEQPITNGTRQDLRRGVRPDDQAGLSPDCRGIDYLMLPGDQWCVRAPGRRVTFAIQLGNNAIVVLGGGCEIKAVSITEHIVGERPARVILPIAG
jgi:hypothetical protein